MEKKPPLEKDGEAAYEEGARAVAAGPQVIAGALASLPETPGVYRMVGRSGNVLYVGKAKNLQKRVASYRNLARLSTRVARMVAETASMEFITTHTEAEALLLEANLIKKLKPHYNILFRDDKSFPYILITGDHAWPQIMKYRGARNREGEYFGPFASAGAVNKTLAALERAFPLRSCSDNIFSSRTRPCLQYQIKRCSGPCVGRINREDYEAIVQETRDFLAGRSRKVQESLDEKMRNASEGLEYEKAAVYRDRIQAMTQIQARQDIAVAGLDEADVIAIHQAGNASSIQVFFFRAGQNLGNRSYFPSQVKDADASQVLAAFLGQFYDNKPPPKRLLLSHRIANMPLMAEALSLKAGHKVTLSRPERGAKRKLLEPGAGQRAGGARPAAFGKCEHAQVAGRGRRDLRSRSDAGTDRGLRQQPHLRHERGRRHDRGRSGRVREERLPKIHHPHDGLRRDRAGRRLRDDAGGLKPALRPGA